jgi:hypothetical protein
VRRVSFFFGVEAPIRLRHRPVNSSSGLPLICSRPAAQQTPTTVLPTPCGQSSPPIVLRWRESTRIKGVTLSLLRASWLAMRPLSHVREGAPSKPRGKDLCERWGAPGLHACKPASMWPDSIRLIVMHRCRCCTGSVSKDRWDQLAFWCGRSNPCSVHVPTSATTKHRFNFNFQNL